MLAPYPLLILAVAWGTAWQMQVVSDDKALVTSADMAAMDWVRANIPPDARFLVNSFPAYGGTLAAGTDAGWWLPLLAHRATSLPPLTYGSELGEQPDYERNVNAIVLAVRRRPLTDPTPVRPDLTNPKVIKALVSNGIEYVYSGAHPFPDSSIADRIDTGLLRASPAFRLIYDHDGVEIFQIQKSTP